MKLKITKQNYLLYLVIFALILLIFLYFLSDKDSIIRQLYKELSGSENAIVKEGLNVDGLDWTVYKGDNSYSWQPISDQGLIGKPVIASGTGAYNFTSIETITNNAINTWSQSYTIIIKGYFMPNKTGNWSFRSIHDDYYFMWLGDAAASNWNANNTLQVDYSWTPNLINAKYSPQLVANVYYPIRIQMSQGGGPGGLKLEFKPPDGNWTSNGSGLFVSSSGVSNDMPQNGLIWKYYPGYFWDDVNYTIGRAPTNIGRAINTHNISSITNGKVVENAAIEDLKDKAPYPTGNWSWNGSNNTTAFTMDITGYFYTNTTNTDPTQSWSFLLASDDASYLWIGDKALSGWTTSNADINNGGGHAIVVKSKSLTLEPNKYYPIRIMFGEWGGAFNLRFIWKPPGGNWTGFGSGYLYTDNNSESKNDHIYYSSVGTKT